MAFEVPKIKKEEYTIEDLYRKRWKYYLFGALTGGGMFADAIYRSRNPYEAIEGLVVVGSSMIGYAVDYKLQFGKGFKGKKLFTFADGTKIVADSRENAVNVWKKHHKHKKEPDKFGLFHKEE
jgi:hypothetical protein